MVLRERVPAGRVHTVPAAARYEQHCDGTLLRDVGGHIPLRAGGALGRRPFFLVSVHLSVNGHGTRRPSTTFGKKVGEPATE